MITSVHSVEDVVEVVRGSAARRDSGARLLPVAGATKPGLSNPGVEGVERLDLSGLSGVMEYDPAELTITALAGTPVSEVQAALAEHGQYLPFDPPLAAAGATLGGTVAAGASGSGALRSGGLRDFVIGVRFVDGAGRLVAGGGKVVKNAAGFDLPKLLIGSVGRLGVIVSLSFKVFPQPAATTTLEFATGDGSTALESLIALQRCPVELDALDLTPAGALLARVGGRAETLEARPTRLAGALSELAVTRYDGPAERALWDDASELAWRAGEAALIRVGLSIRQAAALDTAVATLNPAARIRYSLGATVAWISWPAAIGLDGLDAVLRELELPAVVLFGESGRPTRALLGPPTGGAFAGRVKHALDPDGRFLELEI